MASKKSLLFLLVAASVWAWYHMASDGVEALDEAELSRELRAGDGGENLNQALRLINDSQGQPRLAASAEAGAAEAGVEVLSLADLQRLRLENPEDFVQKLQVALESLPNATFAEREKYLRELILILPQQKEAVANLLMQEMKYISQSDEATHALPQLLEYYLSADQDPDRTIADLMDLGQDLHQSHVEFEQQILATLESRYPEHLERAKEARAQKVTESAEKLLSDTEKTINEDDSSARQPSNSWPEGDNGADGPVVEAP